MESQSFQLCDLEEVIKLFHAFVSPSVKCGFSEFLLCKVIVKFRWVPNTGSFREEHRASSSVNVSSAVTAAGFRLSDRWEKEPGGRGGVRDSSELAEQCGCLPARLCQLQRPRNPSYTVENRMPLGTQPLVIVFLYVCLSGPEQSCSEWLSQWAVGAVLCPSVSAWAIAIRAQ